MSLFKPTRPNFNRRELLRMAALAPAFAMPATAKAMLGAPAEGNPAHFSFTLGQARITIVSDGFFTLPFGGQAMNAPQEERRAFLAEHLIDPEMGYSHTNHMYIELGEAKVLVDVGSGNRWFDTTGRLMGNLEAAGIDPFAITHVAITHAHPDHIWGIRDDFDEPILPDAEYVIGEAERAHWLQDGLVNRVAPEDQQFVLGAVNSINAEGLEWTLARHDQEIAPGIRMIDSPGHTPGHMSVMVESEGQQLLALGDCMTHAVLNFAHPEWFSGRDADGAQTGATRKRLLDMAATDRIAVLGYHFPFPGVGHVARDGDAYRFVPALWQF
ncbi:N-acyl homoserine lactonase [Aliiroseovarius sp. xm-m-379]|uniref:MBL fold metallo-hydrolase n=1 Tax=unclassified Aliiroseovarius TaxID=2623558 RepID=UPI0015683373|nr:MULTISPECIES: MBL fold metallo-hydrolase [unclassified Aliiroseovarius]NRP12248.1 N-acyl homoserine lactonase [Aliiroseovarius sp. xm-d-517]NRP24622.1 N-acyl homoserine lactonase [Aliiroseovarius sp. xm-m-379]NRP30744.1 N-acyl homoserine lactonase [Aliiroseovarius sp. xm-m-314]NRP33421.1 N-acyl homoserine lactonase [Aliiroseovarius sp. xm-a-104]NRP40528.1 N-acyl homoserine lactonase [Aliiroseovarius sp. xm-m-339-2]